MQKTKDKDAEQHTESMLDQLAINATEQIGSLPSLIIHSLFFVGIFGLIRFGFTVEQVLLILTTVVSLEAIYLAIFIQMSINRHSRQIAEVGEDVDYIQENVDEISKDIDSIQEEAKEISADVEGIQEHIVHIDENMEDLSEELEKDDKEEATERAVEHGKITRIEQALEELLREVKGLK